MASSGLFGESASAEVHGLPQSPLAPEQCARPPYGGVLAPARGLSLELVEGQDLMSAGEPPGTFEILSLQDQLRRTYRVTGEPGAWSVEEQGRAVVQLWHEVPPVRDRLFPPVASPSGRFTLHWDAVSDDKGSSCEYRLSERDGSERWFQLPLRLESAVVSDEGEVVGFGAEDTSRESPLVLVGVGREGQVRFERRVPRRWESIGFTMPPIGEHFPIVRGVTLDETSGEAVFLLRPGTDRREELWYVNLEDGSLRQVPIDRPRTEEDLRDPTAHDLFSVPGTGLVLVHWTARSTESPYELSGLHALHDLQGQVVWQADSPQDYGTSRGRDAYRRLLDHIDTHGLIRTDGTAGEFRIVDPSEQAERTYRVAFEDGRWRVEPVGREVIRFWEALFPNHGAPRMRDLGAR